MIGMLMGRFFVIAVWLIALSAVGVVMAVQSALAGPDYSRVVRLKDSPCYEDEYLGVIEMRQNRPDIYECRPVDHLKRRYR